jgi:hypothetical protein
MNRIGNILLYICGDTPYQCGSDWTLLSRFGIFLHDASVGWNLFKVNTEKQSEQKPEAISPECILYFACCSWKRATNGSRAVHTHRASTENVWPLYQHLGRIDVNPLQIFMFTVGLNVQKLRFEVKSNGQRVEFMRTKISFSQRRPNSIGFSETGFRPRGRQRRHIITLSE